MIAPPAPHSEVSCIQNPFENKTASDPIHEKDQAIVNQGYIAKAYAISNPFKVWEEEKLRESTAHPNQYSTANGGSLLSLKVFQKCKDIRKKANELARFSSLQSDAHMSLQASIDEIEKRSARIKQEIEKSEMQRAGLKSLTKNLCEINDRIAALRKETQKLRDQTISQKNASSERKQQISKKLEHGLHKVEELNRESSLHTARIETLRSELYSKKSRFGNHNVSAELDGAIKQLAQKRLMNEKLENELVIKKREIDEKRNSLSVARKNVSVNIECLRKLKAFNERLRLITINVAERLDLADTRSSEFSGRRNIQLVSVFQRSLENISSAVERAKTALDHNDEALKNYSTHSHQIANERMSEADNNAPDDVCRTWKDVYGRFCENWRKLPYLDQSLVEVSLKRSRANIVWDHSVFDAKAGVDLLSEKDNQPADGKDTMNEASVFHGESIWVFQEPKSEVFDNCQCPDDNTDLSFLNELKQPVGKTIGSYPIPDYPYDPRTPSRGLPPRQSNDFLNSASVAFFEWESVLPPSPHDKPSPGVALSMDFLREPEGGKLNF
ncbi:hypothetical protein XU18_3432 [Perkinsela sp. CCAP 1560/4]|nr:hypothetical protein XU18_3432 [Perkinsela sp. CCAP 1560/4]|eukprot:KNH05461.1 hypothetical protein XU18_3432 [Perkinsela sp. CCAP 1560/4]